MTAGTYRIIIMHQPKGFEGLSLLFRVDIWRHGTSRRRALSILQTIGSNEVSAHELQLVA
jgi:hypothetical protein